MSMISTALLVLMAANTVALVVAVRLYRKAKRRRSRRELDSGTPGYEPAYVRDLETRERWEGMDLSRFHEVNREEVERILAKARAAGMRALTPPEKAVMDRMAAAHESG